jgi:hypothetical protein
MKLGRVRIGIVIVLGALLAVGVFSSLASAQTQTTSPTPAPQSTQAGPHPVRIAGNVSSVSANSLKLTTPKGSYTVNIGPNTWIVVQKNGTPSQGAISDVATGKSAVVAGMTTNDPNVIDARVVAQGSFAQAATGKGATPGKPAGRGRIAIAQHAAAGTITAINGTTITLKGAVVPVVNVQTSADTVVVNNGFAAVSSLKVGDSVQVFGRPVKAARQTSPRASATPGTPGTTPVVPKSRTIDAWAIRVDNGSSQLMVARVTAINGNALTVKTPAKNGGTTVNVDTSTGYKVLTVANKTVSLSAGTLSDMKVGSNLIVEVVPATGSQSFTAKAVVVLPGTISKIK